MYNDLDLMISFIIEHYKEICLQWKESHEDEQFVNLKKKTIKNVLENIAINDYIFDYSEFVTFYSVSICTDDVNFTKSQARSRAKTHNSINQKLVLYNSSDHQNGNVPIIKCLNDLLGFRLIIDDNFSFLDIQNYIETRYSNIEGYKLRCIDSSKNSYRATHIYFSVKGSNYYFPCELQVWRKSDEVNNIFSHKIYKQEYTNWEKLAREERL